MDHVHTLKSKVAWITGGRRIGQAIAMALAEIGADLVISYRSSESEAREIADMVKKFDCKVFIVRCDVSSRESVSEAVIKISKKFESLDVLILLASIFKPIKLKDIAENDWDSNFAVHVKGTFWPIQLSMPLMKPGSHIVAISDRTAIGKIYPGYLPYVVTKSAIVSMTKALAPELGTKGIFINSIAPGPILRPNDIDENQWQEIKNKSIINYPISDEEAVGEFVDTVVRLCFTRSSGSVYPVDLGHLY